MRRTVLVTLALMSVSALAEDFLGDRQYGDSVLTLINRVYPARMATHRCFETSIEQCSSVAPVPEKLTCRPRNDGIQLCYGKKKLFSGNGDSNQPIGPEWREFRVRNGKVEAEWAIVQVVELRELGDPPDAIRRKCEEFGAKGYGECGDVVPLGSLPAPVVAPQFNRAWTSKEIAEAASTVHTMQFCMQTMPDLREPVKQFYTRWRQPREEIVRFMETRLAAMLDTAAARAEKEKLGVDSQEHELCGNTLAALERQSRAPDPRFKSAESTWAAFKAAMARGDGAAAAACFSNPYGQFGRLFTSLSAAEVKELGASLVRFDMLAGDMPDFRTGFVERADGIGSEVLFAKMGDAWYIVQL